MWRIGGGTLLGEKLTSPKSLHQPYVRGLKRANTNQPPILAGFMVDECVNPGSAPEIFTVDASPG